MRLRNDCVFVDGFEINPYFTCYCYKIVGFISVSNGFVVCDERELVDFNNVSDEAKIAVRKIIEKENKKDTK